MLVIYDLSRDNFFGKEVIIKTFRLGTKLVLIWLRALLLRFTIFLLTRWLLLMIDLLSEVVDNISIYGTNRVVYIFISLSLFLPSEVLFKLWSIVDFF